MRGASQANHGISKTTMRKDIDDCLVRIGCDTTQSSGKSMRQGGLSVALHGGVDENLRMMRSGHASTANMGCETVLEPSQLYAFSRAVEM